MKRDPSPKRPTSLRDGGRMASVRVLLAWDCDTLAWRALVRAEPVAGAGPSRHLFSTLRQPDHPEDTLGDPTPLLVHREVAASGIAARVIEGTPRARRPDP